MAIASMWELFVDELGDIYDAEHRFLEAQQEMARIVTDRKLKDNMQEHVEQTREQMRNLEKVFGKLGQEPERKTCPVADGLVRETRNNILDSENESIRDSVINVGVAKVEHYEIAGYRALITGARTIGQNEIVSLLRQNLQQEEAAAQAAEASSEELLQKALQEDEE